MFLNTDLQKIAEVSFRSQEFIEALNSYSWNDATLDSELGDTKGIMLNFKDGNCDEFSPHPDVREEEQKVINLAVPFFKEIKQHFKKHKFVKGEIYNCPQGSYQHMHIDPRVFHRFCNRIHLPLQTNEGCFLQIADNHYHLDAYNIYEFNNMLPHRSYNIGKSNRIHIVLDLMNDVFYNHLLKFMNTTNLFEYSNNPGTDLVRYIDKLKESRIRRAT
jgi:hypothetical protein